MQLSHLITLLIDEVSSGEEELLNYAVTLCQESDDPALEPELNSAASDYAAFCRRLGAATESVALQGLSQLAHTLAEGLSVAGSLPAELRVPSLPLLMGFSSTVADYLTQWRDGKSVTPLAQALMELVIPAEFLVPLSDADRRDLLESLLTPPSLESQQLALMPLFEPLQPEQLGLSIPSDADPSLLESFLAEAPNQLLRLAETVQALITGTSAGHLEEAHRIAHTLKGSAAISGVPGFATLAHALEDVLEAYRQDDFLAPPGLHSLLLDACDQLDMALDVIGNGSLVHPRFAETTHALHAWSCHLQGQGVPQELLPQLRVQTLQAEAPSETDQRSKVVPASSNAFPAQTKSDIPTAVVEEDPQVRVPARALELVFRSINELSIGLQRLRTQNEGLIAHIAGQAQLHATADGRLRDIEQRVVTQGLGQVQTREFAGAAPAGLSWTPEHSDFDALELDQYNALVGDAQALREALGDLLGSRQEVMGILRNTTALAHRQLQLVKEAQFQISNARLRSLSEIRSRLRRTVRQACEAVGHDAELQIDGDELRVDAAVLGPLTECLMHLLRNAVDHGIELPTERLALGKPAVGRIQIQFKSHGGGVVVRIIDDGRGMDHAAILKKAVARGLVSPDAVLSQEQISRLIFLAGFSTRETITQTSGRGVGLDVVSKVIASLQGQINVQSKLGAGSEFRLFVLASVGTMHAMHVEEDGEHFLVPSIQLLRAETADSEASFDIQATSLGKLLHGRSRYGESIAHKGPLLHLDVDGQVQRVEVQRVVEAREFLFNPPPPMLVGIQGVTGVATMGDGSLALVLDLVTLCRTPLPLKNEGISRMQTETKRQTHVLVVDDSASVRNTLGSLLRDQNYLVTTARDGLEAIQAIHKESFSLVLTDLEMPQVNGFELTEFIRQRSNQTTVPVLMLTSRGQDKHRQRAHSSGVSTFLVKPYSDAKLLQAVRQLTTTSASMKTDIAQQMT